MGKATGCQDCTNCLWFAEITGVTKPHPLRCTYNHFVKYKRDMEPLPEARWCMHYRSADGQERTMPIQGIGEEE